MSAARHVFRAAVAAVAAVFATHALAYHLIALLPAAATRMAGLLGGHEPVVSALQNRLGQRTYLESLTGFLTGDFGSSVHGVAVLSDLARQLGDTGPRLMAGALLVGLAALAATALAPPRPRPTPVLDLLCLMPPYLHAFVALVALLALQVGVGPAVGGAAWWAAVLSAAVAPAALVAAQARRRMSEALSADHATFARSMGLGERDLRRLLRREVWVEIAPSVERVLLWLFLSMLFSEIVLSLPGVGSSFAVALRNSDVNMLLAQIGAIAILSNSARIVATIVRARHGITD